MYTIRYPNAYENVYETVLNSIRSHSQSLNKTFSVEDSYPKTVNERPYTPEPCTAYTGKNTLNKAFTVEDSYQKTVNECLYIWNAKWDKKQQTQTATNCFRIQFRCSNRLRLRSLLFDLVIEYDFDLVIEYEFVYITTSIL